VSQVIAVAYFSDSDGIKALLFAADGVFDPAYGVLDLSGHFITLAFGLKLSVSCNFANHFLHSALGLIGRPGNTIFIHDFTFLSIAET
jgi:hypothetical protein